MSQTILLKRSAVASKVPTTSQLETGELAVNTVDGKLYLRGDNGTPFVKEVGADPFPAQAGLDGMFLKTDGAAPYWSDTGGTATRVPQPAHNFSVGDILRFDGTNYVKASAAAESTADVIGIVTDVMDANTFELTTSGIIDFPVGISLTPGQPYFLSTTLGELTPIEPTAVGNISKPLFIALTAQSGLFYNWRGIEITPQVEIDQMLPAQTGNAGSILMTDGVSAGWKSVAQATASVTVTAANTFTRGQIVKATASGYALAQANTIANSQVFGIISSASPTSYTITTSGNVPSLTGLVAGQVYYLSDATPGALVTSEPTAVSSVSKPVFIATSTTEGVFFNQRGLVVAAANATPAQLLPSPVGQNNNVLISNGSTSSWTNTVPNATYAGNANALDGIDSSGFWQIGGNQNADIASNFADSSYPYAAIEVREMNHGGAYDGTMKYAPRISFHWGSRVASQIGIEPSGRIAIMDNPGTGYADLVCATMYGRATSANYADLAEKYVADANYEPGTVLSIGGDQEVTVSAKDNDTKVVGVVSTNPAYLMNDTCEGEFVVALALTGRAPCKVTGPVSKGDMLVSNGDGTARAMVDEIATVGAVIGKALQNFDGETGVIEVLIGKH